MTGNPEHGCRKSASQKSNIHGPESETLSPALFTPVLAKRTKGFGLVDTLSVGLDRIQRKLQFKATAKLGAFLSQLPT
jgi:hypothetical protein